MHLIKAPAVDIDRRVAVRWVCMREASRLVLGGALVLGCDAKVVHWPERYMEERGVVMWDTARRLLEAEGRRQAVVSEAQPPRAPCA